MNVSMPSTGFYLFLQQTTNHRYHILQKCVNALNGLLLISSNLQSNYRFLKAVSMPSTGFYLFLPKSRCSSLSWFMCQCPQRASTYLFKGITIPVPQKVTVSMPSTGFYLFLQYPPRTLDFTEFWRGFLQVIN